MSQRKELETNTEQPSPLVSLSAVTAVIKSSNLFESQKNQILLGIGKLTEELTEEREERIGAKPLPTAVAESLDSTFYQLGIALNKLDPYERGVIADNFEGLFPGFREALNNVLFGRQGKE